MDELVRELFDLRGVPFRMAEDCEGRVSEVGADQRTEWRHHADRSPIRIGDLPHEG